MLLNMILEKLEITLEQKLLKETMLSTGTPFAFTGRGNNHKATTTIAIEKHFFYFVFHYPNF